jgi:hypothetical protein
MNPVSLDGRPIIIFDGPIQSKETKVLAAGFGTYDGATFAIEQANADSFTFPENYLDLIEMPLMGHWKERYPDYEWYFEASPTRPDKTEPDGAANPPTAGS